MKTNTTDLATAAQEFFAAYDAHDVEGMFVAASTSSGAPFLHVERASPECHAVDRSRRWARVTVSVS
jgi:hypothetical protein